MTKAGRLSWPEKRHAGMENVMRITGFGIKTVKIPVFPIFFVGALAGIFAMSVWKDVLLENTGLFDEYTLYNMKYMSIDSNALFSYLLRERILGLLILAVLSSTYLGWVACIGTTAWYGMSVGAFFSALTLRYGIKGIFLAFTAIFPHYLIYAPAMLALLGWGESLYRGIYHRTILPEESKAYLLKKIGSLVIILLATVAGCLLEAYVNPYLLLSYLKVF